MTKLLPPGQREISGFPRFGLLQFARRFPKDPSRKTLHLYGAVEREVSIPDVFQRLPRVEQVSDFHCVTTWSRLALRWGGVRFADFYQHVIQADARPGPDAKFLVLRGQDGYRTCLLLEDLLKPDVLLADELDGKPLSIEHGAPLRLIAPAQYGYKSVKHLSQIELRVDLAGYRPPAFQFMDHRRARVALEERGRWVPGWLLRNLYRLLAGHAGAKFARAMDEYNRDHDDMSEPA